MKCSDVLRSLNDDTGGLDTVRGHLEDCPECSRRFARDLEIEEALRNLKVEVKPVDITARVGDCLNILSERRTTYRLFRRWLWGFTSAATLVLLTIATPILAGWLGQVIGLADRLDTGPIVYAVPPEISPMISSMTFIRVLCLMVAILTLVAAYLWREARRTVS